MKDGPIGKILYRRNGKQWTLLATFEGSFGHEDKVTGGFSLQLRNSR